MKKTINVKDFLIEINKLLEIVKSNSFKKEVKGEEREVLNLTLTTDKIYSLYMQKMADMSREELQELLDETKRIITLADFQKFKKDIKEEEDDDISKEEKQLLELVNTDYSMYEYTTIIRKVFRTILEIDPEKYPIIIETELLNADLTDFIKYSLPSEENDDEFLNIFNFDFSVFIPFIVSNKTFEKYQLKLKEYFGTFFSMPFDYDVIKVGYILEQVIDYLSYRYPDQMVKFLIITKGKVSNENFSDFEEVLDINFSNFEKLTGLIIDIYIETALNLKKKTKFSISKVSKFIPKIKKYIRENIETLEITADKLIIENSLEINLYNKNMLKEYMPPIKAETDFVDKKLFKDMLTYGLEHIKETYRDYLLIYPSDELIKLPQFVMSFIIETGMNFYQDFEIVIEMLKSIINAPYISREYDYSPLETSYKMLDDYIKENDDKILQQVYELRYLYLSEQYEEFIKKYKDYDEKDKDESSKILYQMAKYFTGEINKEELIKILKRLKDENDYWMEILDVVILALEDNKEEVKKLLDEMYPEDILEAIYIYPYEPTFYESLELEYEFKPKEKKF